MLLRQILGLTGFSNQFTRCINISELIDYINRHIQAGILDIVTSFQLAASERHKLFTCIIRALAL